MQQLYDAVRATGAENLVIAGGVDWAYDLTGVPQYRIDGYNVLYATHPYGGDPTKGGAPEKQPQQWDGRWGFLTQTDPVIVTEFGDYIDCGSDAKVNAYVSAVITYADSHSASWTAWAWYPGGCKFPALINDWSGTPTSSGMVVQTALAGLQPTGARRETRRRGDGDRRWRRGRGRWCRGRRCCGRGRYRRAGRRRRRWGRRRQCRRGWLSFELGATVQGALVRPMTMEDVELAAGRREGGRQGHEREAEAEAQPGEPACRRRPPSQIARPKSARRRPAARCRCRASRPSLQGRAPPARRPRSQGRSSSARPSRGSRSRTSRRSPARSPAAQPTPAPASPPCP